MFAEFEKITHDLVEKGEPLTSESLCKIYYDLNKKYFGEDLVIDEKISIEWARIPHFYNSFYVYQYATGYSCAIAIAKNILENKNIDKYLEFLKKGDSEYSIDLLKQVGVNISEKEPIEDALKVFSDILEKFESNF